MRHEINQPISVLHLMNGFADSSISRIVQRVVAGLGQRGYIWHVGALADVGDMQSEFARLGAQVISFSREGTGPTQRIGRLRQYIVTNRIGIIHTHTPKTILFAAVALVAVPHRFHVATKHLLNKPQDRKRGIAYTLFDRFSLYLPNQLIAVSHAMQSEITSLPGLQGDRVKVIRNAIPCDIYNVPSNRKDCRLELGLSPEVPVVGYAGRIDRVKRIDLLLAAFSVVLKYRPGSRLLLVGDGELRRELESLAIGLGISDSVLWTGFRHDIPRLLAAMDIYVQPSTNEGLSLSLLEAMAAGKQVVATGAGGTSEIVVNGETGLLIPPGSSAVIADAVINLLENPGIGLALAEAGRARVRQEFDLQLMVERYGEIYESLAARCTKRETGPLANSIN